MEKGKESKKIINIDLEDDENENNTRGDADQDVSASAVADTNDDMDSNNSSSKTSNLPPEGGISNTSSKKNKKITRALKDILTSNSAKFMSNFDPELSNRERRKLNRKFNVEGKKSGSVFDDNGASNGLEKDICDCLVEDCPGCHFPCPKCRTCKCAVECRINRKWIYEAIENETELATNNYNVSTN